MKQYMKKISTVGVMVVGLSASAETIKLKVNGMVCSFCAQGITKKLKAISGVENVDVALKDHLVTVKTKDKISDEKISTVIKDAGYEVKEIKREE